MNATTLNLGQRVRVYYNLRKHMLSVMDAKTRKVIAHVDSISLDNVRFIVSQAGLVRIRREQRKQVIAFVEGYVAPSVDTNSPSWEKAYFNPYKVDTFVVGEQPLHIADRCCIQGRNVLVEQYQEAIHGNV